MAASPISPGHNSPLRPSPMAAMMPLVALLLASMPDLATAAEAAPSPLQGSALLKADILCVFAHPDDETGVAPTLARHGRGENRVIANVYVTRGEGGGNMVGTQSGPALGILREAELRDGLGRLGVRYCHFLDQTDFFYTESLSATLRLWNKEECLRRLVRLVRTLRPEILVTMNPAPSAGQHGHHQAAGVLAIEAFDAAADANRFSEQIRDEGLAVWQPRKLFFGGTSGPHVVTLATTEPSIDGRTPADWAGEALSQHRSQGFGAMLGSPWLRRPQNLVLAKSVLPPRFPASSLFDGLPLEGTPSPIPLAPPIPKSPMSFVPRPAVSRYLDWAAEHGVGFLAGNFRADRPAVAGEPNTISLVLQGRPKDWAGHLPELILPPDWELARSPALRPSANDGESQVDYQIRPPRDARADVDVLARAPFLEGNPAPASIRLHPIPKARVPRVKTLPWPHGFGVGSKSHAVLDIGPELVWEGRSDGAADLSATVRLAHDGQRLMVQVAVRDDVIVSNIEPNDIRGHWRSDSVELCLDPEAGAEDTSRTFKLGIFPFDTRGQVRGARDADARQGPIERTAPGLELASSRTPDGYEIRALVPWRLVTGGTGRPPHRVGFNVLIYDGDKAGAVPGENINEGRLAWAPRSGVQGRPEDWGRLDLE